MADNIDFSRFAGRVSFPRTPSDLVNTTQCPACFTTLKTKVCESCGLDLNHPIAAELHDVSLASAATLNTRLALIGRIRYDTEQVAEAQATQVHDAGVQAVAAETTAASAVSPEFAPPAAPTTQGESSAQVHALIEPSSAHGVFAPMPPVPAQPAVARRKNSTIQIIILSVGVSLLSIATIFFLVYAFVNYGITWRTIIIATLTIATIVAATLFRRHKLTATGEGIAALAVVFIYGDAYALRANDYFGLANSDAAIYWGTVLVGTAAAFILWYQLSGLRTPNIVALGAFAPGVGVLVGGLVRGTDYGTHYFFVFATIAVAGLVHRFVLRPSSTTPDSGGAKTPERIISLTITTIALITGFFIAFVVAPTSDWSGTIAAFALAAITGAHLWAIKPVLHSPPVKVFGYIFSSAGAIIAASAVGIAALRIHQSAFDAMGPLIAATVVTLALEAFIVRSAPTWKRFSTIATLSAAGVVAITLILPVSSIVLANFGRALRGLTDTWSMRPTDIIWTPIDSDGWAVLALTVVGILATLSWAAAKTIRQRGPLIVWLMSAVIIAAVAIPSIVWVTVASWLVLAAISVLLLILPGMRTKILPAYRAPILATAITTMIGGYLLSWASTSTWWIGSIAVVVLLVALRFSAPSPIVKAALLGIAGALTLIASNALAQHLTINTRHSIGIDIVNGLKFVSIAAAIILVLSAAPLGRWFTHLDRRVTLWLGGIVSVIATLALVNNFGKYADVSEVTLRALLLPEYASSLIIALIILCGFVMWVALRHETSLRLERITASIVIAPAIFFVVMALTHLLALPPLALAIAPVISALLTAVASLTVAMMRPAKTTRWAFDIGVVLVALPSVSVAVLGGGEFAWLVLVLAAVTVLLLAISEDGLFASSSWRKYLGWLALALATAGLWWQLSGSNVTAVEPYVLPLSASLLIIAFLLERVNLKNKATQTEQRGTAAPLIALGGFVVSVLPLTINASGGTTLRAGIIAAVAVLLVLAGSFVRGGRTAQRWWDSAALAGALGVVVLMIGRASHLPIADPTRDAWIIGGFACLIAAAYGQTLPRKDDSNRMREVGSQILGLIAMTVVMVMEFPAFDEPDTAPIRVIGIVILFAAVHVIALLLNKAPFTRLVGWIAIGFAVLASIFGSAMGAIYEPEFVTLPIALALLITGTMHMRAVAAARSWLWLAPGVTLLLLPSLIETFRDQNMWRVVILGLVGVAVIIISAVRKLQAPFAISVVIVLIHGIATFLPQLRAAYLAVPWWLWLAAGGTLLIVLAIRYERRLRDLKSVVNKFAELR